MKIELMGEGTYHYECDDPFCCFCEKMGLKPFYKEDPAPEVFIIPMAVVHDQPTHPKKIHHLEYQKRTMREMNLPRVMPSFMKHDKTY
jgi:hypothetical protein